MKSLENLIWYLIVEINLLSSSIFVLHGVNLNYMFLYTWKSKIVSELDWCGSSFL